MTDPAHEWVLVDFDTPADLVDVVSDALWSLGVAAVEELPGTTGRTVLRTSLGAGESAGVATVTSRFAGVKASPVRIPSSVADTWREFVGPTQVIDDIWLVPQWCEPPAGRCILIEPFDTFGMGNHPTTVLTLRAALTVTVRADTVLDLGSGSGVLAVALASLVGCSVEAHDIAPQGESALAHNAQLNSVSDRVSWLSAVDSARAARYDVVMANILAPVLRQLAGDIEDAVRAGGVIVLSGLREEQVQDVVVRYEGSEVERIEVLDGWAGVVLRRNG